MTDFLAFLFPIITGILTILVLKLLSARPFRKDMPYDAPPPNWIATIGYVYMSRAEFLNEKGSLEFYRPEVGCVYLFNGESHSTLMRLPKNIRFSSRGEVENFLTDYPKGLEITVYHHPTKPDEAFAIPQT